MPDHEAPLEGDPSPLPAGEQQGEADRVRFAPAELQQRAMAGTVWTSIHSVISAPVNLVANLIVARSLGPTGFGLVALLSLIYLLAVTVSEAGFNGAVNLWGAAEYAHGRETETDELLRKGVGWQILVETPFAGIVMAAIVWHHGLAIVGLTLFGVAMNTVFCGPGFAIYIENRTAQLARWAIPSNLLLQASIISVAIVTRNPVEVWLARLIVGGALTLVYLIPLSPKRRRASLQPMWPRRLPDGMWRFIFYRTMSTLVGQLSSTRSEILILAVFGDRTAIGIFALAYGLASQLTAPVDAVLGPLSPASAALVATSPHRAEAAFLRAMRFTSALSGVLEAVALSALTMLVPLFYGAKFHGTELLLVPLGVASCLQSMLNPVTSFVSARRQAGLTLKANSIALVADLGLACVLVPFMGVWGAVIANIVGSLANFPFLVSYLLRCTATPFQRFFDSTRTWWVALVAVAAAVGGATALGGSALVRTAVATAVGGGVFVLGVRLWRAGFGEDDRSALQSALPRPLRRVAALGFAVLGST